MVIKANIVKNQEIGANLNQGAGGFNAPVQSVNGKTGDVVLDATDVGALPNITVIPSKVSELENDEGYLTDFSESDPTVPAWAKAPTRPKYTAAEVGARPDTWTPSANDVGADPEGTAEEKVSEHNTNTEAHNDIRLLIKGLASRLNALADSDDVTLDQMSELVAYIKENRDLIEGVTTNKVNVSDIINNLTTNVSNKPLSAAMGVELVRLIEDIEIPANLSELKDDSTHRVVSDAEKARWNSKSEFSGSYKDLFDQPFGETWLSSGSDTLVSDNIIYGGYRKVSNTVPSMEDIEKGYAIKYYQVSNGAITGDPITLTNSNADMSVRSGENGILINYDGVPFVIISFTGIGTWSALKFSEITSPGVYFLQYTNICVESIQLTDYDGFPLKVLQGGVVKTVNHVIPDENGNVNVEGGSGSDNNAFTLVKGDTLAWNGNTEGKVVAFNTIDPSMSYVRVSDVVPTVEDLQSGGAYATTGADGIEYEEPFASENITDNGNMIYCCDGYLLVAKEDNVHYVEGTDIDCTLPKAGIYFINFGVDGYTSKLSINGYDGFVKPILKMESLTPHNHDWYGKPINKGNTVRSDDVIHDGFVKVSDAVPTLVEVQKGGTLRFYDVVDGELSGDLIVGNYLESPYSVVSSNGEIWIASDGIVMVQIKDDGVYFRQDENDCMHSLTINGYEGFNYNVEKIPTELIPDGIGSDADWNAQEGEDGYIAHKPFGETTVIGDTLTWDGDTEGLYNVMGLFYHVSDAIPTMEDLQNGGFVVANSLKTPYTFSDVMDLSALGMGSDCIIIMVNGTYYAGVAFKAGATATMEGVQVTFDKAGVYLLKNIETDYYISGFTVNGFTGFTGVKIDKIPMKYIPEFVVRVDGRNGVYSTDTNFEEIYKHRTEHIRAHVITGSATNSYYELVRLDLEKAVFMGWHVNSDASGGQANFLVIDNQNNISHTTPDLS